MLGIGLSLLGFGKNLLGWLMAGVKWLFAAWERIVIFLLLAAVVWFWHGKGVEARRADKWAEASQKWQNAHNLMVVANEKATKAAKANAKRVEREYQEINDEAEKDYADGLAANRASLERWKLQNRRSATRQGNSATPSEMPSSPVPEAEEAQFLVRGEDLEIAADNYSQLVALIDWAERIGNVETAPPPD